MSMSHCALLAASGADSACLPYCAIGFLSSSSVAFKVYDMDRDGYISNGELFLVLKMMVGSNLKVSHCKPGARRWSLVKLTHAHYPVKDQQLQQIVDKTMMEADQNGDGKLDFDEFKTMVQNTDIAKQMTLEGESGTGCAIPGDTSDARSRLLSC